MVELQHLVITIQTALDILTARSIARDVAGEIGFDAMDQARISTAVSELSRNIVMYTPAGSVTVRAVTRDLGRGIEFEFRDQGPGIEDVQKAMQEGYTTSHSMGMGLSSAKSVVDEFEIESQPGKGTTIICRKWLP